jgi:hypothetical protein
MVHGFRNCWTVLFFVFTNCNYNNQNTSNNLFIFECKNVSSKANETSCVGRNNAISFSFELKNNTGTDVWIYSKGGSLPLTHVLWQGTNASFNTLEFVAGYWPNLQLIHFPPDHATDFYLIGCSFDFDSLSVEEARHAEHNLLATSIFFLTKKRVPLIDGLVCNGSEDHGSFDPISKDSIFTYIYFLGIEQNRNFFKQISPNNFTKLSKSNRY